MSIDEICDPTSDDETKQIVKSVLDLLADTSVADAKNILRMVLSGVESLAIIKPS